MALSFDQYLGIAGLIVGIIGVAIAVRSDQKMKTAREAEKQIERKFVHYMAAQEFEKLAMEAVTIVGKIRGREWGLVAEMADSIGPSLGQVRGARTRLLQPLERDKLDGAAISIQQFTESLPLGGGEAEVSAERVQTMISQCRALVDVASELAGRLRVESMQQPEEKK
jgi:hypothetical protein